MAATQKDGLRKPAAGMWDFYLDTFMEGLEPGARRGLSHSCASARGLSCPRGMPQSSTTTPTGALFSFFLCVSTWTVARTRVCPCARARADMEQSFFCGDNSQDRNVERSFADSCGLRFRSVYEEFV